MDINIKLRQNELSRLQNYLKDVDTEVTMILQNLQWDRKHLAEHKNMAACQYDLSHSVPPDKLSEHEKRCFLKCQGYTEKDRLLPSPFNPNATTLVKLSVDNVEEIINDVSHYQPLFKTGAGCSGHQPLTLERLQSSFTPDERRAIHDAVVNQVPSCHDLSDLALLSSKDDITNVSKTKSKLEILAELRDMRRRRTKYRVAAKTRNYSDVLRDVITTQMDLYNQTHNSKDQINMSNYDQDTIGNPKDDKPEVKVTKYGDNTLDRRYHTIKGHKSISANDILRQSKYYEGYEFRNRRHHDSDHVSNSIRHSKIQYSDESGSSKVDKCHMYYDSKSKRRNDEDKHSAKANSKRYDDYRSRHTRHEKEYDRRRNSRAEEHSSSTIDCKRKDRRHDYRKLKGKYHSYERDESSRVRQTECQGQNQNRSFSPKRNDDVGRQKRYEYKGKETETVRFQKIKDYCSSDDCNNSEDNETEYSNVTSHNYSTSYNSNKQVKIENELYVKKEGNNNVNDDRVNVYGSSSSETCNEKRNTLYGGHNTYTNRDNNKYYEKRKDRINGNDIQQQQRKETAIQQFKLEKDISKQTLHTKEAKK